MDKMSIKEHTQHARPVVKRLTEKAKAAIVKSMKEGLTSVAQVARDHHVSRSTVERLWQAHRLETDPEAFAQATSTKAATALKGKQRSTSLEQDKKLFGVMRKNPGIPLKSAMEVSGYPGSVATARKRLKEARVKYVTPQAQRQKETKQKIKFLLMSTWASQPDRLNAALKYL